MLNNYDLCHQQVAPSVNQLESSGRELISKYPSLFKPEPTYSGYRVEPAIAVRAISFIRHQKTTISNIRVNTMGDGVQVGNANKTPLTFRKLNDPFCSQAVNSPPSILPLTSR